MGKNETSARIIKSSRKPLRDLSNNNYNNKKSSSILKTTTKTNNNKTLQENRDCCTSSTVDGDALDRLLLVQSDLSSLIHQIDELVVEAFKLKATGKEGRKEIESFTDVLSKIHTSLKPWAPRFQKALSSPLVQSGNQIEQSLMSNNCPAVSENENDIVQSPEPTKSKLEVSPSPLVSWHANCTVERGRQLFMLTPLPRSKSSFSNLHHTSKPAYERLAHTNIGIPSRFACSGDENDNLLEGIAVVQTPAKPSISVSTEMDVTAGQGFVSTSKFPKRDCSMLVMTPRFKMSPPKSCVLLEPISESSHLDKDRIHKSTPFPIGIQNSSGSEGSPSSSQVNENLALRYPELVRIKTVHNLGFDRKEVRPSLEWFMSPFKTCVLMEPPDEKLQNNAAIRQQLPTTANNINQQTKLFSTQVERGGGYCVSKKSTQELVGMVESTPMPRAPVSTIRGVNHPGENTLKKELWTKFEAASISELCFDVSSLDENSQNGFLARLDEVSSDETSLPEGLR